MSLNHLKEIKPYQVKLREVFIERLSTEEKDIFYKKFKTKESNLFLDFEKALLDNFSRFARELFEIDEFNFLKDLIGKENKRAINKVDEICDRYSVQSLYSTNLNIAVLIKKMLIQLDINGIEKNLVLYLENILSESEHNKSIMNPKK